MSEKSRYHERGRSTKRSRARSLTVTGASPGGTPRHFCVPEYTRSAAHPSTSTGMPPSDVTVSTSSSASPLCSPRGVMSLRTPVEVSAWQTAIPAGAGGGTAGAQGGPAREAPPPQSSDRRPRVLRRRYREVRHMAQTAPSGHGVLAVYPDIETARGAITRLESNGIDAVNIRLVGEPVE